MFWKSGYHSVFGQQENKGFESLTLGGVFSHPSVKLQGDKPVESLWTATEAPLKTGFC